MTTSSVHRDGRVWRLGTADDVAWIDQNTVTGLTITSAIPPIFEAYATVVIPDNDWADPASAVQGRRMFEEALVGHLVDDASDIPWMLGFLDTTSSDDLGVVTRTRIPLYANWPYVVVEAGAEQAQTWRTQSLRGGLPDLIFPIDRRWLASRLWDDDWWCLGGPATFISRLLDDPRLEARSVTVSDDATPPGHVAR